MAIAEAVELVVVSGRGSGRADLRRLAGYARQNLLERRSENRRSLSWRSGRPLGTPQIDKPHDRQPVSARYSVRSSDRLCACAASQSGFKQQARRTVSPLPDLESVCFSTASRPCLRAGAATASAGLSLKGSSLRLPLKEILNAYCQLRLAPIEGLPQPSRVTTHNPLHDRKRPHG